MMQPRNVTQYVEPIDNVAQDFVNRSVIAAHAELGPGASLHGTRLQPLSLVMQNEGDQDRGR